jgi:uncharacterized protein YbjQ (UPF0145 family)
MCKGENKTNATYCTRCGWNFLTQSYDSDYCPTCNTPLLHPEIGCPYCPIKVNIKNKCELCNKYFHKNFFSNQQLSLKEKILLNMSNEKILCPNCVEIQRIKAYSNFDDYRKIFSKIIREMPVLTLSTPLNLTPVKYCDILTTQSLVKNTHSKSENVFQKLDKEKRICITNLKKNALLLGANSIIGFDMKVDEFNFSQMNFLISATGTAIIVQEFNILTEEEQRILNCVFGSLVL